MSWVWLPSAQKEEQRGWERRSGRVATMFSPEAASLLQ